MSAAKLIASVTFTATLAAATSVAAQEPAASGGDWVKTLVGLDPKGLAAPLRLAALVTVFSIVPSVVLLTTCFPRLLIVLSFLRRGLGTQDLPPNSVIAGLAFILTGMVMMPVWKRVHDEAYVPLTSGKLATVEVALERAGGPLKDWMLPRTRQKDLALFSRFADEESSVVGAAPATRLRQPVAPMQPSAVAAPGPPPAAHGGGLAPAPRDPSHPGYGSTLASDASVEELPFFVVLPAFVLSELKTAFQMGFLIYLPFLVIDLAVSAILISMGMFMLPPILISLPLKVLVFVLVDGWTLVVEQLLRGLQF
jgi:flagellar biosynthetic protein FliP